MKIETKIKARPEDLIAIKQNNIEAMKEDLAIREVLMKHHFDEDVLSQEYRIFLEYFESVKKCRVCKGLDFCLQKSKGQRASLGYDHRLFVELEACEYQRAKKKKDQPLKHFVYHDIPKEYESLTLGDITESTQDKNLLFAISDVFLQKEKRGYYLFGDLGVGKTYLCMALMNSLAQRGYDVAFVKASDFINKARKLVINDSEELENIMKRLKRVPYLTLDDIGSESVSSFSRDDILFDLLDYRMEHGLTTFFTSNLDLASLLLHYQYDKNQKEDSLKARRLLERIEVLAKVYCLKGRNLRVK